VSMFRRKTDAPRLALRAEGGFVYVEVHSDELKEPLSFPVGNFDYIMQRGEPYFVRNPHVVSRLRAFIELSRTELLRSLPAHMWDPPALTQPVRPPLLDQVLFFFLSKEDAIAFPGDHVETFEKSVAMLGPRGARIWYLKELAWMAFDTTLSRLSRVIRLLLGQDW
jgi:hypothetical protein